MDDLGLIGRSDQGGLAAQSQLVARLLRPSKVVVVDMGDSHRGVMQESASVDWGGAEVLVLPHKAAGSIDAAKQAGRFLRACSAVHASESWYWPRLPRDLSGSRICVHANGELWRPTNEANIYPALPTGWHAETLGFPVVPHPTPFDQSGWPETRQANEAREGPARRVLHIAAPAMLDRNGTDPLLSGLGGYVGPGFTLFVAGAGLDKPTRGRPRPGLTLPPTLGRDGQIAVERVGEARDRLDLYRRMDLLVIPRRYAGLCLPAQEAASAGVPVLMSDLDPQTGWPGVDSSIRCGRGTVETMRGGRFRVAVPDPRSVAQRVWAYTQDSGETREQWQTAAVGWALAGSWAYVEDRWDTWLRPR